jgi:hypothetical protein
MFVSTLVIGLLFFVSLLSKKMMIIEEEKIIYRNYFSKNQHEFSLSNIIDFTWQGGVRTLGTRYGTGARLSNDAFELTFESGQKLFVEGSQYANFWRSGLSFTTIASNTISLKCGLWKKEKEAGCVNHNSSPLTISPLSSSRFRYSPVF